MKRYIVCVLALFCAAGCKIEFKSPEKELKAVVDGQAAALNAEEMERAMGFTADDAPMYEQQFAVLQKIKAAYDLDIQVLSFDYAGTSKDGKYAFAVVKQKTTKKTGPDFRDNIVTFGATFRKTGETWKLWQSVTFDIEFL